MLNEDTLALNVVLYNSCVRAKSNHVVFKIKISRRKEHVTELLTQIKHNHAGPMNTLNTYLFDFNRLFPCTLCDLLQHTSYLGSLSFKWCQFK